MQIPESPRFLGEAELFADARHVLRQLARQRKLVLPDICIVTEREKKRRIRQRNGGTVSESENESPAQKVSLQPMEGDVESSGDVTYGPSLQCPECFNCLCIYFFPSPCWVLVTYDCCAATTEVFLRENV